MKLDPQFFSDFSGGQVNNLNEKLAPKNTLSLALNVDCDEELGSAVSRLGTSIVGTQMVDGNTVLGLHYFRDSVGSGHKLFGAINASGGATSVIYDVNDVAGGAVVSGLTASLKMRFLTYLDSCLAINGTDAERAWNGSSWVTTGGAFDLANMPAGKYPIELFDRVYVAGVSTAPDRLYYSSLPVSGAVAWAAASGGGNVDIEPEDGGGGITGLGKVPGYTLIFKERSLHRFNFDSAFPESLINIGTPSHESIVNTAGICAFFSASSETAKGFYITDGGQPVPISHDTVNGIKKFIDAIPQSYESSVSGIGNGRHIFWSIGDVTVDGRTFSNVVLKYSIWTKQWTMRTYPSEFKVFATYVSSSKNVLIGGDDDGQAIQLDVASTYTDYPSTTPIQWEIRTQKDKFGFNQIKEISDKIIVDSVGANGALVKLEADPDLNFVQSNTGEITKPITDIKINKSIKGNHFFVTIQGNQTGGRATIKEIELPSIDVLLNYEQ